MPPPDEPPSESAISRLSRQIEFSLEIDKLKGVLRQTVLLDSSRQENVAEHSWHIAVMAGLLREYAVEPVDIDHAIRMLLVHDLVEIDAGDVMIYDRTRREEMKKHEEEAARRIFGLLPADQAKEMRLLWDEYEARETPEARFAFALDRIQPLLHNLNTQGLMWRKHGISRDQVIEVNRPINAAAPALWEYVAALIDEAAAKGYLRV